YSVPGCSSVPAFSRNSTPSFRFNQQSANSKIITSMPITTPDDARRLIEERGLSHVKLGVFDVDGVLRGKYMSREKFFSALDNGFGFCDVVLGWDSNDRLYDNVSYTG